MAIRIKRVICALIGHDYGDTTARYKAGDCVIVKHSEDDLLPEFRGKFSNSSQVYFPCLRCGFGVPPK